MTTTPNNWTPDLGVLPRGIVIGDDSEPEPPNNEAEPLPIDVWWSEADEDDFAAFAPKLEEYGAHDLLDIGRGLAQLMHWDDCPERVMYELGCWFYLRGKLARAWEALEQHRLPSDDTAHDITVYSKMIRRIRYRGELA